MHVDKDSRGWEKPSDHAAVIMDFEIGIDTEIYSV
jgi:hypothetical protein